MDNQNQKPKEESSLDIVSLNKLVVNMRDTTKKSKMQVIQRLNKTIKALKQKDTKPNDNRHKHLEKLLEAVAILKTSSSDDITKFCLIQSGSVKSEAKDREQAAMMRMMKNKAIADKIQALKKEHEDWDSLVFFLKNHVPRRVKKKATTKRNKKAEKRSTEFSSTAVKVKTETSSAAVKAKTELGSTPVKVKTAPVECKKEEPLEVPMTTDETLAKLRNFGGVVRAFDAGDDCVTEKFDDVLEPVEEKQIDRKTSKKRFFEGCDDDDEDGDKNEQKDEDVSEEESYEPKHKQFAYQNKQRHAEIKRPFVKNNFNNKSSHYNNKQTAPETREKKHIPKKMENLHPSWEAKRKEKEMMKSAVPQSKKIIFDD